MPAGGGGHDRFQPLQAAPNGLNRHIPALWSALQQAQDKPQRFRSHAHELASVLSAVSVHSFSAAQQHRQRITRARGDPLNGADELAIRKPNGEPLQQHRNGQNKLVHGEAGADTYARPDSEGKIGVSVRRPGDETTWIVHVRIRVGGPKDRYRTRRGPARPRRKCPLSGFNLK